MTDQPRITLGEVQDGQNIRIHTQRFIYTLRSVRVAHLGAETNVIGTTPIGKHDYTFSSTVAVEVIA